MQVQKAGFKDQEHQAPKMKMDVAEAAQVARAAQKLCQATRKAPQEADAAATEIEW